MPDWREFPVQRIAAVEDVRQEAARVWVPPPLVYAAGIVVGLWLHSRYPVDILPAGIRPVGWVLIAAGVLISASAIRLFQRAGTTVNPRRPVRALVTDGPYRFTRNPMYLGLACVHAGVAFAARSLWTLVLLAAVLMMIQRIVIKPEEQYLRQRFGGEYERYAARVRRWI